MKTPNIAAGVRSALMVGLVTLVGVVLGGCNLGTPEETAQEVNRRHRHIIWNDTKQIQSDVDAFLMLDRPSKLTDRIVR
jgi:hypothetical protein